MTSALFETTSHKNARLVPVEPKVKPAKTCDLSNNHGHRFSRPAKSADPTCYNSPTVELTGLFENAESTMRNGDVIRFKTTGYEIADVRNPNPPKEWTGYVIGGPNETHVVLWCERERREAAPVMVSLDNVICNETELKKVKPLPRRILAECRARADD